MFMQSLERYLSVFFSKICIPKGKKKLRPDYGNVSELQLLIVSTSEKGKLT